MFQTTKITMDIHTCYNTLGLQPHATYDEIKQAYRRLVLQYHPDKNPSKDNEIRFKQISEAYQTLRTQPTIKQKEERKFSEIYPEEAVENYEQANTLFTKQKYEEAILFYDKTLSNLPRFANAWRKKGDALSQLKKYSEALGCYEKALQIEPDSSDLLSLKGICLADLKEYDDALVCFEEAILIEPKHAAAWNFKGVCLFSLEKFEKALECFEKAIKYNPEFTVAWYNKGGALQKLGKMKESEKCYEKARKLRQ